MNRRSLPSNLSLLAVPSGKYGHLAAFPPAAIRGRLSYSGFTLLELLLVLFIMGLLATTATIMVDGLDTQSRYDETKRRMLMIKHAIAGDPQRIINNQPDISGFVADIGRPPETLSELVEQGETLPGYKLDEGTGLSSGWRGPYLEIMGSKRFYDGYGNSGDDENYGWIYSSDSASGVVSLTSRGPNAEDDGDNIKAEELLVAADHKHTFTTVKINIHNRLSTMGESANLKLRLYYPEDGEITYTDSVVFLSPAVSAVQSKQVTATFSPPREVPIGVRAFVVVCDGSDFVYDGNCDGPAPEAQHAVHFTLAPRAQPAVFDWILQ
jgi:prepilin-type N-terminal cleavage/methylation domain-containing protein